MTGAKATEGAVPGRGEGTVAGWWPSPNGGLIGGFVVRVGRVSNEGRSKIVVGKVKPRTVEGFEASVPLPNRLSLKEQHMNLTYIHRQTVRGGAE